MLSRSDVRLTVLLVCVVALAVVVVALVIARVGPPPPVN